MELSSEQIDTLRDEVEKYLNTAQNDYSIALTRWHIAIKDFSGAFVEAHKMYKAAIEESASLKKTVFDLSFAALSFVCGRALSWIQAALIERSDFYQRFCEDAFGGATQKWLGGALKGAMQKFGLKQIGYRMPAHLSTTDPLGLSLSLDSIFLKNKQVVDEFIFAMREKFRSYEGIELLTNMTRNMPFEEAQNKVRWEFGAQFRQDVLGSCYYFNKIPDLPSVKEMAARIERAMWAETFKGKSPVPPKWLRYPGGITPPPIPPLAPFELIRFLFYKPGAPVEQRLIQLGVMAPPSKNKVISYPLKNFGAYTDDKELKQLLNWAYAHEPEHIGGPPSLTESIPGGIMSNYRKWQLRAVC